MANNDIRQIYVFDLTFEMHEFKAYHMGYGNPQVLEWQHDEYIAAVIEQMIAHFEYQNTAVQSFIQHYTDLITEMRSIEIKFHPLRFLKPMLAEQYQGYVYVLYGFAERVYRALEAAGMYQNGRLLGSWQHLMVNTLYLIERPEVPIAIFK